MSLGKNRFSHDEAHFYFIKFSMGNPFDKKMMSAFSFFFSFNYHDAVNRLKRYYTVILLLFV